MGIKSLSFFKINILLIALLFLKISFAQDDSKNVSITASGNGKTLEDAKQSALRSATEQAFGAFISTKTEMLNDKVVADQMSSVSSGNIKSFEILNEAHLPDGNWAVTVKAIVSIDKLISFVQSKGITIEMQGGLFALNIKQQLLNEQGEIKAISEMIGLLHESMQISLDYKIMSSEPRSVDADSKNWEIPLEVTAITNKNMDLCAGYFLKNLQSLSLSNSEVESYRSLNKKVYSIVINYKGEPKKYFLRKLYSMFALQSFAENWEFYTRTFIVQSGIDESIGKGAGKIMNFLESNFSIHLESPMFVKFPSANVEVAKFNWNDKKTLAQIEKMNGYTIKPSGVISQFQHGGYVVHGPLDTTYTIGLFINEEEATIKDVDPYSSSYRSGLKDYRGGKIIRINNNLYKSIQDLNNAINTGEVIHFEIESYGQLTKKDVKPVLVPPQKGLVAALFDLGSLTWNEGFTLCDELVLNGYSDWQLPNKEEFSDLNSVLIKRNIGGFKDRDHYWTGSEDSESKNRAWPFYVPSGYSSNVIGKSDYKYYVRPIRYFN